MDLNTTTRRIATAGSLLLAVSTSVLIALGGLTPAEAIVDELHTPPPTLAPSVSSPTLSDLPRAEVHQREQATGAPASLPAAPDAPADASHGASVGVSSSLREQYLELAESTDLRPEWWLDNPSAYLDDGTLWNIRDAFARNRQLISAATHVVDTYRSQVVAAYISAVEAGRPVTPYETLSADLELAGIDTADPTTRDLVAAYVDDLHAALVLYGSDVDSWPTHSSYWALRRHLTNDLDPLQRLLDKLD